MATWPAARKVTIRFTGRRTARQYQQNRNQRTRHCVSKVHRNRDPLLLDYMLTMKVKLAKALSVSPGELLRNFLRPCLKQCSPPHVPHRPHNCDGALPVRPAWPNFGPPISNLEIGFSLMKMESWGGYGQATCRVLHIAMCGRLHINEVPPCRPI